MFLQEGDNFLDVLPEMHVGRITAQTRSEASDYVQKVLDYESMDPTDTWRKRGVFVADDQYSTSITFSLDYCFKVQEQVFRTTTEAICESIRVEGRLTDFECIPFFLNTYLDTVPALRRDPGNPPDCPMDDNGVGMLLPTRTYTRAERPPNGSGGGVTGDLIDLLTEGHLLFEFTGHGNKNIVATETLFEHQERFSIASRDMDRIHNFGKPFVFLGYACHLAEFEHAAEGENGKSIGDALLLAPNRGAIGVMASTGSSGISPGMRRPAAPGGSSRRS
jgi:hypothetical protein